MAPHVSGAFGPRFRGRLRRPQLQKRPQGHEDSEYVLGFEIGQREVVSIANGQTDRQIDSQTESPSHPVAHYNKDDKRNSLQK